MNALLWLVQLGLAVYFFSIGVVHFVLPPGLPWPMAWMYDLPPGLHYLSGGAEILAAFGLVLPGLTGIRTQLTPLAALGLLVIMIGAMVWHLQRTEFLSVANNVVLAAAAAFVAHGRWRLSPLETKRT